MFLVKLFKQDLQARQSFLSETEFLTKTFLNQDFYTLIGIEYWCFMNRNRGISADCVLLCPFWTENKEN